MGEFEWSPRSVPGRGCSVRRRGPSWALAFRVSGDCVPGREARRRSLPGRALERRWRCVLSAMSGALGNTTVISTH